MHGKKLATIERVLVHRQHMCKWQSIQTGFFRRALHYSLCIWFAFFFSCCILFHGRVFFSLHMYQWVHHRYTWCTLCNIELNARRLLKHLFCWKSHGYLVNNIYSVRTKSKGVGCSPSRNCIKPSQNSSAHLSLPSIFIIALPKQYIIFKCFALIMRCMYDVMHTLN